MRLGTTACTRSGRHFRGGSARDTVSAASRALLAPEAYVLSLLVPLLPRRARSLGLDELMARAEGDVGIRAAFVKAGLSY